jgi:hypothetical protein
MKSNYYDPYIAPYTSQKKEYKVLKDADKDFTLMVKLKLIWINLTKFIDELEPGNLRLPVPTKKYIKKSVRLLLMQIHFLIMLLTD